MEDSVVASGVEERCLSLPSFPFAYGSASPEFVSHLIPRSMYICYSDAEDIHLFYYIFVFFFFSPACIESTLSDTDAIAMYPFSICHAVITLSKLFGCFFFFSLFSNHKRITGHNTFSYTTIRKIMTNEWLGKNNQPNGMFSEAKGKIRYSMAWMNSSVLFRELSRDPEVWQVIFSVCLRQKKNTSCHRKGGEWAVDDERMLFVNFSKSINLKTNFLLFEEKIILLSHW